jgi:CRP/FNR family transcriptional regulator, cyclic AMP receptor protein
MLRRIEISPPFRAAIYGRRVFEKRRGRKFEVKCEMRAPLDPRIVNNVFMGNLPSAVRISAMMTIGLFRNATDTQSFAAGQTIFAEGDAGHQMFVVKEGDVEVLLHGRVIETLSEGAIVGEMALIDARPRSATVRARTDCTLVPIDERRFAFLIQQTPQFGLHVMRVLADRLRQADRRL